MSTPSISTASTDRLEALEKRLSELEKYLGVDGEAREFHGNLNDWNTKVRDAIQDLQVRAGLPDNQTIDPADADHIVPPPPPPFIFH